MSKITKIIALGAAATVVGAAGWHAYAQTPTHGGHGMGPGMMMGMHHGPGPMGGAFADPAARLATLKTELGVTAQQQAAWDAYAKTVQDTAAAMTAQRQGVDKTKMHAMSDQERQAFMGQMRERRNAAFATVKTAAESLLPALDDAQKAKAKEILPGLAAHRPGMMRHAMGGGPGMHAHHMPHGAAADAKKSPPASPDAVPCETDRRRPRIAAPVLLATSSVCPATARSGSSPGRPFQRDLRGRILLPITPGSPTTANLPNA